MSFQDLLDTYEAPTSMVGHTKERSHFASIPHQGSLCQVEGGAELLYLIEIFLQGGNTHELVFRRQDFDFSSRLFAILDSESRGQVSRRVVKEFVTLRCPVFWRRDEDLKKSGSKHAATDSPTFDEIWDSVVVCSNVYRTASDDKASFLSIEIGLEGWMVFCRFIALAQYLEAKRRFSGRHLQQTMRHRNSPRGSELVVVDVPPMAPPVPLLPIQLANYERTSNKSLPLPELDLDHSLVSMHDSNKLATCNQLFSSGRVKIDLFGANLSRRTSSPAANTLEFCVSYRKNPNDSNTSSSMGEDTVEVRRSMADMKWLDDTFRSQKILGGTLCGRILPPFPSESSSRLLASHFQAEDSTLANTSGAAMAAAAAGVGIIKEGIKSLWGTYITTGPVNPTPIPAPVRSPPAKPSKTKFAKNSGSSLPESYYNPHSPEGKARQLERYLTYLMQHPALSTSFPLNVMLKASQSGLDAAKKCLEEHDHSRKDLTDQISSLEDGKLSSLWSLGSPSSAASASLNLSWIRTAAQAAVALQIHGILETSGLPSASARLQHASLPNYDHARVSAWNDEENGPSAGESDEVTSPTNNQLAESFEEGVAHVDDELNQFDDHEGDGDGYDLLPLPVPAPERTILNVGDQVIAGVEQQEGRFRYGSPTLMGGLGRDNEANAYPAYIGEIAVDENIDKLREVIGSVDNTLSRSLSSAGKIGKARRQRNAIHLEITRDLDSWEGLRGKFISQRALLKGMSGMEQSRDVYDESDIALIDALSWQASLAHSAVSAAEDVRSTVRAAKTAANAKAAAIAAAGNAQQACDKGKFKSIDEARAAQTRASIAQSHAIHSAVVEHEAMTVKRRATLALAHDVKCWNVHRKREVLHACLTYARSQHEATRRAVDAWTCLRDGFIGASVFPSAPSRKPLAFREPQGVPDQHVEECSATIYENSSGDTEDGLPRTIIPKEHELFKSFDEKHTAADTSSDLFSSEQAFPLAHACPIPEGDETNQKSSIEDPSVHSASSRGFGASVNSSGLLGSTDNGDVDEKMTESMQSLVDGLMNWGGQYDSEEDLALPMGMAASIALEESGLLNASKNF